MLEFTLVIQIFYVFSLCLTIFPQNQVSQIDTTRILIHFRRDLSFLRFLLEKYAERWSSPNPPPSRSQMIIRHFLQKSKNWPPHFRVPGIPEIRFPLDFFLHFFYSDFNFHFFLIPKRAWPDFLTTQRIEKNLLPTFFAQYFSLSPLFRIFEKMQI